MKLKFVGKLVTLHGTELFSVSCKEDNINTAFLQIKKLLLKRMLILLKDIYFFDDKNHKSLEKVFDKVYNQELHKQYFDLSVDNVECHLHLFKIIEQEDNIEHLELFDLC